MNSFKLPYAALLAAMASGTAGAIARGASSEGEVSPPAGAGCAFESI